MKFLHPSRRTYGELDDQAELISKTLRQRRMRATSFLMKAEFRSCGEYEQLHQLRGPDFRLVFGRPQWHLGGGINDCAGLSEVIFPGKHIVLTQDAARLRLYDYVGDNWRLDSDWFFAEAKVNSRKRGLPRRTILYTGSMIAREVGWRYTGILPHFLVADPNDGLEYRSYEWDKPYWETAAILREAAQWVQDNVLRALGVS